MSKAASWGRATVFNIHLIISRVCVVLWLELHQCTICLLSQLEHNVAPASSHMSLGRHLVFDVHDHI